MAPLTVDGVSVPGSGAYGLTLGGLVPAAADLVPAVPAAWPTWHTSWLESPGRPEGDWSDRLDGAAAVLALGAGTAVLDRQRATTVLRLPVPPTAAELAHPFLSATGAVAAWWRGDVALHGGAFLAAGAAWVVLGDREAGKSTAMAGLWLAGAPVLADDLVVLRGDTACAGPRTLDLRRGSAEALGIGEPLGVVGMRERWRVQLGPVPPEVPLGGFVQLAWGDRLGVGRVPPAERPAAVVAALGVLSPPADPARLLPAFARPMLRLTRPRDLSLLASSTALLLAETG